MVVDVSGAGFFVPLTATSAPTAAASATAVLVVPSLTIVAVVAEVLAGLVIFNHLSASFVIFLPFWLPILTATQLTWIVYGLV